MSIVNKIKNSISENILGWAFTVVAAVVAFLMAWAFPGAWVRFSAWIIASVSPEGLLAFLCMTTLVLFVVLAFFIPHLFEEKKTLLGGIYWDKKKNPYCPACKTPVAKYGEFNYGDWGYYCNVCRSVFNLADASGNPIKPEDARRML